MSSLEIAFETLPMVRDQEELETVIIDGRFKLLRKLGYGGQSEVFLAHDAKKNSKLESQNSAQLVLPPLRSPSPKKNFRSSLKGEQVADKNLVALKVFKNTPSHKVKHEYKVSKAASSGYSGIVKPKKLKVNATDLTVGADEYETELHYIAYEFLGGESLLQKLMREKD